MGIVGPAGAEVVALAEVAGGLVKQPGGFGQVGLADALRAHGVVAPATQVHLVGFFHVAINLHHVGGGGSVAGAGGSRQGSVDLAREVAGAQRVAAAGSGAQRPGQRPVLLARVGADLVGGADVEDQRYCDPALVVFVSTDPVMVDLKNARNFCRYCYGGDSPYRFVDSDGHAESPAWMRSFIPVRFHGIHP